MARTYEASLLITFLINDPLCSQLRDHHGQQQRDLHVRLPEVHGLPPNRAGEKGTNTMKIFV